MKIEDKQIVSSQEVAEVLGISVPMVRKLIRKGELLAVHIGRCLRVPSSEVLRLVNEGTIPKRGRP